MSAPTNFVELTHSEPAMAVLRALRDQHRAGIITDAEYAEEFARLNRGVGLPCDVCEIAPAHVMRNGRKLCARCALKEARQ